MSFDPGPDPFRLRIALENTGGNATGEFELYAKKNSGSYAAVTTSSTGGVKSYDASSDADDTIVRVPRLYPFSLLAVQATHFDAAATGTDVLLTNLDNTAELSTSGWKSAFSTTSKAISDTGLYYYEFKINAVANTSSMLFGLLIAELGKNISDYKESFMGGLTSPNTGWERAASGTGGATGSSVTYFGTTPTYSAVANDIMSVAVNFSSQKAWIGYNNNFGTGSPADDTNPDFTFDTPGMVSGGFHDWYIGLSLNGASGSVSATVQTAAATQTYPSPIGFTPWDN